MDGERIQGKYNNENISIEIIGQSTISYLYCVQIKVLKSTPINKAVLEELGQSETCYRLTKNAWFTRERLLEIFKQYNLRR